MFETYGKELNHVISVANNPKTANTIWTIVSNDDGNLFYTSGYHLVNRFGYLITEESYDDNEVITVILDDM